MMKGLTNLKAAVSGSENALAPAKTSLQGFVLVPLVPQATSKFLNIIFDCIIKSEDFL